MTVIVDIFRVLAAITSTLMLLSPVPSIYHIYKTKSTGVGSIVPLVSLFANAHVAILYGYMNEYYFPIFSTFVVGDLLGIAYIAIFYRYSPERRKAHQVFLLFGLPLALLTLYAFLGGYGVLFHQTRHQVGVVLGYGPVVTNIILYSSPFEKIVMVLHHQSAVFLNIHMVTMGTVNTAVWIVYTATSRIWVLFAPIVFCCAGGCLQIALYWIYHPATHPYHGPPMPSGAMTMEADIEMANSGGIQSRESSLVVHVPATCSDATTSPCCFVPLASPSLAPPCRQFPTTCTDQVDIK